MLFNSVQYLLFLPAAWAVFWLAPDAWRIHVLLIASYVFYASWSPPYAAMLFGLAILNYFFGLAIHRASRRKLVAWCCVSFDLVVLGFFKYWNFGLSSAASLAGLAGVKMDPVLLQVVLPLGISFFTFEFIHYLVDIYRGDMPVHNFSKFHVFCAFFPTQIAGPIKRFQQFVPALSRLDCFDPGMMRQGVGLVLFGLAKKLLIADRVAPLANAGFAAAGKGHLGTLEAWSTALAFSLQIYADFSGYTDIARGSAMLFGFHIPLNFNAPYLATSVADFWHRWHISLSTWLRDYVYIPLGGSRGGTPLLLRNLLITFVLGGLWHGAAWHFVAWGACWGFVLCAARLAGRWSPPAVIGWLATQTIVVLAWVLFRAGDVGTALSMFRSMLVYSGPSGLLTNTVQVNLLILLALFFGGTLALRRGIRLPAPRLAGPLLTGAGAALMLAYMVGDVTALGERFIYFQF